jgi:hypothetical protein
LGIANGGRAGAIRDADGSDRSAVVPALQPPGAACTGADLAGGQAVAGEPRHLGLLGGELAAGLDGKKIAFDAGLASKGAGSNEHAARSGPRRAALIACPN